MEKKPEAPVAANLPNLSQPLFDLEVFLETNKSPMERYMAIDGHVRTWYRTVLSWPYIAKYCDLVESERLYELGGYATMTDWLKTAAPRCERSIREYRATRQELAAEFTDDEQSSFPVETAKTMAKHVPKEQRKNPR